MRKLLAASAIFLTLFGALAPYGFSANEFTKKTANAAIIGSVDTSFGNNITIEPGTSPNTYILKTTIKYDSPLISTGGVIDLFGNQSAFDPNYAIKNTASGNTTNHQVDNAADLGLTNNTWGTMKQTLTITADGTYEAWFWEDYVWPRNDLESSKIRFTISNHQLATNPQPEQFFTATNVRNDVQIIFGQITARETNAGDPTHVTLVVPITYQDDSKTGQTVDSGNTELHYTLVNTDENINSDTPLDISGITFKYGEQKNIEVKILRTLTPGKTYTGYVYDKNFTTTTGDTIKDNYSIPVGNLNGTQSSVVNNSNQNSVAQNDTQGEKFCGDSINFSHIGCWLIVGVVQYVILPIPSFVAAITGAGADLLLKISISADTYGVCPGNICPVDGVAAGLKMGWGMIRDFSNIGFIFALFIAAFGLILGKEALMGFKPKETVVKVIIMALLVNFSMFFCRMIIQTADIFSHVLYNKVDTTKTGGDNSGVVAQAFTAVGIKSPSLGLVSKINPQEILTANDAQSDGGLAAFLIISLISFFLYLILIAMFAQMAFIFAGRIFGLWIGIILSPLAFVSYAIPFLAKNEYIGFEKWIENFTKLAFTTPIYLFFIYLALKILELNVASGLLPTMTTLATNQNWFVAVFYLTLKKLIPTLAALFIFMYGKKIATSMSGAVGEMAAKYSGMVSGVALGAATGGTAFIGRQTLGRAGAAVANNETLLSPQARGGFMGGAAGLLTAAGSKTSAATFDVRNSETAMKGFSKFTGAAGEKIDLGTKLMNKGGFMTEGRPGEIFGRAQQGIADRVEKSKAEAAEKLKINAQARDEVKVREAQANQVAATTKLENEKKRQDTAVAGFRTDDKFIAEENKRLDNESKMLEDTSKKIGEQITKQADKVKEMENNQAAMTAAGKPIPEKEKWALDTEKRNLQSLKDEKAIVDKAVVSVAGQKTANAQIAADIKATAKIDGSGGTYQSVAEMERDKKVLEQRAETSQEKIAFDKTQEDLKKAREKEKQLKKNKEEAEKRGNIAARDQAIKDLAELNLDKKIQDAAKARDDFDKEFTSKIKSLNDAMKGFNKTYKDTDYNKALIELGNHQVSTTSRQLGEATFDKKYTNDELQRTYAKTVGDAGRTGGIGNKALGWMTGGAFGGESINNAGIRSETNIRNNLK